MAFDGDLDTAWCEGAEGLGAGEWIEVAFSRALPFENAFVHGAYLKSDKTLRDNARLKTVRVTAGERSQLVHLPDAAQARTLPDYWEGTWFEALRAADPPGVASQWEVTTTDRVRLEIVDGYAGERFADLCISEIDINVIDPEMDE